MKSNIPSTSPETKTMYPTIIIGENHADSAARRSLLELLPFLKERGYKFLFEFDEKRSLDDTINYFETEAASICQKNIENLLGYFNEIRKIISTEHFEKIRELAKNICAVNVRRDIFPEDFPIGLDELNMEKWEEIQSIFKLYCPETYFEETKNFLDQSNNYYLYLGMSTSDGILIDLLKGIKSQGIEYKGVDINLNRSSQEALKEGKKNRDAREKKIADTIGEEANNPAIVLVGFSHSVKIYESLSQEKKNNTCTTIMIGDNFKNYKNKTLSPRLINLYDISGKNDVKEGGNSDFIGKQLLQDLIEKNTKKNEQLKKGATESCGVAR